MKKNVVSISLLMALCVTGVVFAENEEVSSLKPQVVAHDAIPKGSEAVVVTLSSDEQAFVAGLTDQNRKSFSNRLNEDQRKSVLIAVENGTDPDEAVHRMVTSLEIKEKSFIVQAD